MTHQPPRLFGTGSDAADQFARIVQARLLVGKISGHEPDPAILDGLALLADAYDLAPSIAQRRFDTFADETAAWAAAGVRALIAAGEAPAAARRLFEELARAEAKLLNILG